jgi:hypothetical protein
MPSGKEALGIHVFETEMSLIQIPEWLVYFIQNKIGNCQLVFLASEGVKQYPNQPNRQFID